MCLVEQVDRRKAQDLFYGLAVDRHVAERGAEGLDAQSGEAAQGDPVRWTDQHHPLDLAAQLANLGIGGARDRTRVHVAGVRGDQGLGYGLVRTCDRIPDVAVHGRAQLGGVAGIEGPGDGGRSDERQGEPSLPELHVTPLGGDLCIRTPS